MSKMNMILTTIHFVDWDNMFIFHFIVCKSVFIHYIDWGCLFILFIDRLVCIFPLLTGIVLFPFFDGLFVNSLY